ncbi:MAG: hypothetical protein IPG17_28600 [Sandaracinaceae bacterium]|jgi:hypothetical protein|nr:hypothetical protein [Sandaracinaceae bacterium]MBK6809703.1 hypothetical protein [Sandaracinaceae bacterium]MBK7156589.1 hypothetical protein [Sandaracinaceae bacterium]MBK8412075.1 hypothetical protein [Sandaracinaceae bacterium]MBK8591241.1 hypothetical protein [Sandaracinaceae bacterium]
MYTAANPVPSYRVSEQSASFFAAASVVRKTGSYPFERAVAVLAQMGLLAGSLTVGILLTAVLSMYVHKAAGAIVFLVLCLGLAFGLMPYIDRRLWAMRAAFTYLATKQLVAGQAAPANNAADGAKRFLEEQFGNLGPVADAHNEVQRLVGKFFRTFDKLDELLPIDLEPLRKALGWLTDRVAPRIADLALSFAIARGDGNLDQASKDAITYVAQNPKPLLGTAIRAYFTEKFLGGTLAFVLMTLGFAVVGAIVNALAGDAAVSSGIPDEGAAVMGAFAAAFLGLLVGVPLGMLGSWFLRTAVLEPISLTMLLIRFHTCIQGQPINPSVRARVESAKSDLGEAGGMLSFLE